MDTRYDVTGLGNAIVDVLAQATDDEVAALGLAKGAMQLIDEQRAHELYSGMGPAVEISGGSAANTIVGVASLGGRAAFVGRVRDDQLGEVFTHDIRAAGVTYETPPATDGPSTARCLILVTPDAQRTLNTYLGAANGLAPHDVDPGCIAASAVVYLEGYLWDPPHAKDAFRRAIDVARAADRKVAFTLSDVFCVERHRPEFLHLLDEHLDIVFANEDEAKALFEVGTIDEVVEAVSGRCDVAAITRGPEGALVVTADAVEAVEAIHTGPVVDTTGAGDLFAAGFLYGLVAGRPPVDCGRLGALCAGEVISHVGARPERPLRELAAEAGLL